MNCRYCGTELPDGALFCGECGRAVTVDDARLTATATVSTSRGDSRGGSASAPRAAEGLRPEPVVGFSIADLAFSSPGATGSPEAADDRELPDDAGVAGSHGQQAARCPQCGEPMAEGDVFCGECGFVLRTVAPPAGDESPQTSIIVIPDLIHLGSETGADSDVTTEVEPLASEDDHEGSAVDDLVLKPAEPDPATDPDPDPDLEFDEPLPFSLPIARPAPATRSRPIPDPFPWGTDQPLREDLEATRLVADTGSGNRFVLQFSTGESVTVLGSGLVGRNPSLQPGEYVDQLVPIFDAGKSVSKTHLEFGQESGRFWVSDRYSTNGSVIRQPDAEPRRCDPGRRYFIARGTRVDVGEQFFVVS